MRILGLINARGGSKGIPRKNIMRLGGKPLIAWTIESALAAKRIDRVVVSTEDLEIADVARKFGADVPFQRPSELATDVGTQGTDIGAGRAGGLKGDLGQIDLLDSQI